MCRPLQQCHPAGTKDYENFEDKEFGKVTWFKELSDFVWDGNGPLPDPAAFQTHLEELRKLIKKRDNAHPCWGWKHAASLNLWSRQIDLASALSYPHFISVWRDPIAAWQRENHAHPTRFANIASIDATDLLDHRRSLRYVLRQTEWMAETLAKHKRDNTPHLLVSYERSISGCVNRHNLVDDIVEFLGLAPTKDQWVAAVNAIDHK